LQIPYVRFEAPPFPAKLRRLRAPERPRSRAPSATLSSSLNVGVTPFGSKVKSNTPYCPILE